MFIYDILDSTLYEEEAIYQEEFYLIISRKVTCVKMFNIIYFIRDATQEACS